MKKNPEPTVVTEIVIPSAVMEDFDEYSYVTDLPQLQGIPFLKTYPFRWWFDALKSQYVFVVDEERIADLMEGVALATSDRR